MRGLFIILAMVFAAPAAASVASGVQKWRDGDWDGAVAQFQGPAAAGDAAAQFHMGQAYLLGRGVQQDREAAVDNFRRAAERGHLGATANLGIALWQQGKRTDAITQLRTAADRGELRAAYVLGTALFTGDSVPRNPALGYAYVARARDGGLQIASGQAARFATLMTADERARGDAAAQALAAGKPVAVALADPGVRPVPAPVIEIAEASEDEAEEAPARPTRAAEKAATAKATVAKNTAKAKDKAGETAEKAATPEKGFRVQLGAYNSERAARAAWATLVAQSASLLKGEKPAYLPKGGLIRLTVGPFEAREEARDLCSKLSAAGRPCFVTS